MGKAGKTIIRDSAESDYPIIAALLDEVFHSVPYEKRLRLWKWRYHDNPARSEAIPHFLVAEQEGKIIGLHGLTPLRVKVGDESVIAGCSCDLAVHPSARSAGLKLKLQAMKKELTPLPMSTSANEPANSITLSLGGKELVPARQKCIKPLRYGNLLRKKVGDRLGRSIGRLTGLLIGGPIDMAAKLFRMSGRTPQGYVLEDINAFDERFDRFWAKIARAHPIMLVRDAEYLNWRYARYPFAGIESFALVRDEEIAGFAAIYTGTGDDGLVFSAILELLAVENQAAVSRYLLGEAIRRADRNRAVTIMGKAITADLRQTYRVHGFTLRTLPFSPFTYKNNTVFPDDLFDNPNNWFTSLGDGDASYYFD